jgi:hypothetical protein
VQSLNLSFFGIVISPAYRLSEGSQTRIVYVSLCKREHPMLPADYERVHRSKVSLLSGQDRLHRNRLIEAIKKALQLRSELEPNGGTGPV